MCARARAILIAMAHCGRVGAAASGASARHESWESRARDAAPALPACVAVRPTNVTVQNLGHRWEARAAKGGQLFFHWRTVLLPPSIIEYVVVHELVHLLVQHHTPAFWARAERAMPDFEQRRRWLAERGGACTEAWRP